MKANAGCILGDNFYYAKDLGEGERSVYWVEGIGSSEPVFHSKDDAEFVVDEGLRSRCWTSWVFRKRSTSSLMTARRSGPIW